MDVEDSEGEVTTERPHRLITLTLTAVMAHQSATCANIPPTLPRTSDPIITLLLLNLELSPQTSTMTAVRRVPEHTAWSTNISSSSSWEASAMIIAAIRPPNK